MLFAGIAMLPLWLVILLALTATSSWWGAVALCRYAEKLAPKLPPPHVQLVTVAIYFLAMVCTAALLAEVITILFLPL